MSNIFHFASFVDAEEWLEDFSEILMRRIQSHTEAQTSYEQYVDFRTYFRAENASTRGLNARDFDNMMQEIGAMDMVFFVVNHNKPPRVGRIPIPDHYQMALSMAVAQIGAERVMLLLCNTENEHIVVYNMRDQKTVFESNITLSDSDSYDSLAEYLRIEAYELSKVVEPVVQSASTFAMDECSGVTKLYLRRADALPDIIADAQNARQSVQLFARVYYSEAINDTSFEDAIIHATHHTQAPLTLRQVSIDPDNPVSLARLYQQEDPRAERWKTLDAFRQHLHDRTYGKFTQLRANLTDKLKRSDDLDKLTIEQAFFARDTMPAYACVMIDDHILYVSFYTAKRKLNRGVEAPAMRLERPDAEECDQQSWFTGFYEEIQTILESVETLS
jgi:hypothetical protein